jgi:hypothetical protein
MFIARYYSFLLGALGIENIPRSLTIVTEGGMIR